MSRSNLRGIVAMSLGMAGFVTNDMLVKLASATLPTGQIIFLRGCMITVLVFAIALVTGALSRLRTVAHPAVAWRTVGEVFSTLLYLTALFHMPIADATAIVQAMPVVFTVVAALFLGEYVGWKRWLAVTTGFIGILLIVRPGGEGIDPYSLFAVAALAFLVVRDVATRRIPFGVSSIAVTLITAIFVTTSGGVLGLTEVWVLPEGRTLLLLGSAAVMLTVGYFFVIEGVRYGDVAAVAPFRYTNLLWAVIYGVVIWGEVPDALALTGIALIVASGLVVVVRERQPSRPASRSGLGP